MTTAVSTQSKQPTDIAGLLEVNRGALLQALPKQIKPDRFLRICLNTIARNPDLQKCTATSLYSCIVQSAQFGLEPGMLNQAHLVPYWNSDKKCYEAQFQIGYLGLRDMAEQHGDVIDGDAQAVYEKDFFDYGLGDAPFVSHKPSKDQERGEVIHFYAWAQPKQGKIKVSVMSRTEVEQHRDRFVRRKKDGGFSPAWEKTFDAMGLKTVIRRCYKLLARSPELREAIALDEMQEVSIPQNLGMEVEIEQRDMAREQNAEALKQLQAQPDASVNPEGQSSSSQDSPPSEASGPFPQLTAENIHQQFCLCESIAEMAHLMNQWQGEKHLHSIEDHERVAKSFETNKKRIGKR